MKLKIISTKKSDISKLEKLKSYIGKKVISKSGDKVGEVQDIVFSGPKIEGIIVSRKLSKIFVDLEYISMSKGNIMLLVDPVIMLKGKLVFDADGKKLGKVFKVNRNSNANNFESLSVKKRIYSKVIKVPKEDIDTAKKNIILKKVYE